jgi:hypothetical protein
MSSIGSLGFLLFRTTFFVWGASPGSAGCYKKATEPPNAGHPICPNQSLSYAFFKRASRKIVILRGCFNDALIITSLMWLRAISYFECMIGIFRPKIAFNKCKAVFFYSNNCYVLWPQMSYFFNVNCRYCSVGSTHLYNHNKERYELRSQKMANLAIMQKVEVFSVQFLYVSYSGILS